MPQVSKLRQPKQLLFSIPISELFKLELKISIVDPVPFSFDFVSLEIQIPISTPFKIEIHSKEKRLTIFSGEKTNYEVTIKIIQRGL